MRAEVVCVGTELLLGDIANTNAQEIGAMLARIGVDCLIHTSVGDNEERIAEAISAALRRADAVVVTGGLGPTQDDVTREAICRATGTRMIFDERLAGLLRGTFRRLRREMAEINLRQAERPESSTPIDAVIGTAPGVIVEHDGKVVYAIPGVPAEMREMMERGVLPDLARRGGAPAAIASRVVRVCGVSESAVAEAVSGLWHRLTSGPVTMAFLAGGGEVRVRLTAKAADGVGARLALAEAEEAVRTALGVAVVGVDAETLEVVVGRLLRDRSWTIACAESLTGGLLGGRITRVAGASDYFRGAIVAYAADAKTAALGVPDGLLAEHGAVSEPVARAMAAGVRQRLSTDVGLAVTGVAGPAEQDAPKGTVFLAVDGPLGSVCRQVLLPGDRETVRTLASAAALNLARLYLLEALS